MADKPSDGVKPPDPKGKPAKSKSKFDLLADLADRSSAAEKLLDDDLSLDMAVNASKAAGGLDPTAPQPLKSAANVAGRIKAAVQILKDDFSLKTLEQVITLFKGSNKTLDKIFDVLGKILKKLGAILSGKWIWTAVETWHEREKAKFALRQSTAEEDVRMEKPRLLKMLDRVDDYRKKQAKAEKVHGLFKKIWNWIKRLWEHSQAVAAKTVVAVKSSAVAMTVTASVATAGVVGTVYVAKTALDASSKSVAQMPEHPAQIASTDTGKISPSFPPTDPMPVPSQVASAPAATASPSPPATSEASQPVEEKSPPDAPATGTTLQEGEYTIEDLEKLGIVVNEK